MILQQVVCNNRYTNANCVPTLQVETHWYTNDKGHCPSICSFVKEAMEYIMTEENFYGCELWCEYAYKENKGFKNFFSIDCLYRLNKLVNLHISPEEVSFRGMGYKFSDKMLPYECGCKYY